MFSHPLPHRIFIYIASFMFLLLALSGGWLTYYFFELSWHRSGSDLFAALSVCVLILVSWLYAIRCTYISYQFLKTINNKVIFDEDSVLIETANGESQYSWSQLGKYKEYKDMDVLSIIGKDNLPIIMLWKYSPNFENFVKVWMVKSGI